MKTKKVQNVRRIAVCGIVLLALMLSVYFYCNESGNITHSVEYAFVEAVEKDFQNRYSAVLMKSCGTMEHKVKGITVIYEDTACRRNTQYKLAKVQPLHPDTLNVLLQEALQKYDVEIPTGIVYRDNRQIQYSGNDSTVFQRSFIHWGKSQSLDAKNELAVQPWISMAPWQVLRNMQTDILWGVLFLIVGLGIIFMPWDKKASAKVSMGGLLLDKEARKVTIDGRECLLRNLEFRLLLMFVEKENHILRSSWAASIC